MSERLGVATLLHTHSGPHYGANAGSAMHLLRGFEPRHLGVYLDPAHLAFNGEPVPIALDMTRGYLKMIGVKNARWKREAVKPGDGSTRWAKHLPFLDEGMVDWPGVIPQLRAAGYHGPLAYHAEVDGYRTPDQIGEAATRDLAYLRGLVNERARTEPGEVH